MGNNRGAYYEQQEQNDRSCAFHYSIPSVMVLKKSFRFNLVCRQVFLYYKIEIWC